MTGKTKVITKLMAEQEALIPVFIKKMVNQAVVPMDEDKARIYITQLYKRMGEKEPIIIFGESPLKTALLAALFFSVFGKKDGSQLNRQLGSQLDSQLRSQLKSQLGSQLGSQLWSQLNSQFWSQLNRQLGSQLDSQLRSQLYSQLDSQRYSQLWSQLNSQFWSQLGSQLRSQLESQLKNINSDWYLTAYWLTWCGWYEYGKTIGVKFDKDAYNLFVGFVSQVSFIIPYKNICFVSHKPTEIHWRDGRLHNDSSAAIKYVDGYSLFSLNGVRVPDWLVTTHSDALDPQKILALENADQRAEGVRKLGIERLINYGEVVDSYKNYNNEWFTKSQYELVDMAKIFRSHKHAYFLKMRNQSVPSVWHMEGVHPDCDTLDKAIRWRFDVKSKDYQIMEIK